jgi:hypothetical protein
MSTNRSALTKNYQFLSFDIQMKSVNENHTFMNNLLFTIQNVSLKDFDEQFLKSQNNKL